jgi:hypothetical protein
MLMSHKVFPVGAIVAYIDGEFERIGIYNGWELSDGLHWVITKMVDGRSIDEKGLKDEEMIGPIDMSRINDYPRARRASANAQHMHGILEQLCDLAGFNQYRDMEVYENLVDWVKEMKANDEQHKQDPYGLRNAVRSMQMTMQGLGESLPQAVVKACVQQRKQEFDAMKKRSLIVPKTGVVKKPKRKR